MVSLLEFDPDLAEVLSDEQRGEARRFVLPVAAVDKGGDVAGLLEQSSAFGASVLEGMLIQALKIGEDPTLRLIGPGSFAPPLRPPRSMPVLDARLFVLAPTRLVSLGEQLRENATGTLERILGFLFLFLFLAIAAEFVLTACSTIAPGLTMSARSAD